MLQNLCDIHTHTIYSRHAYSTLEENLRSAADRGLELLGTADHFSDMLWPEPDVRHFQYFFGYPMLPETWHGVRLVHGCEADIVDCDGHLFGYDVFYGRGMTGIRNPGPESLKDLVFRRCDYVVASVHNPEIAEGQTLARTTELYLNAMADPKVLVLGHVGRAGVPFDLDAVLLDARDRHKLIEINEHSLRDSPAKSGGCRDIAERCAELGVGIVVSSDAHLSPDIGRLDTALAMLEEIHFPQELIATRSADAFIDAIAEAAIPPAP